MSVDQDLSAERVLASAARFLIDGQEDEAASVLLACTLGLDWENYGSFGGWVVTLVGPRVAYDILNEHGHVHREAVERAIRAVLPAEDRNNIAFLARAELVELDAGWRAELLEIARGRHVNNQGIEINGIPTLNWANLRFRSQSEIRVARILYQKGALFFPNCLCRVDGSQGRVRREADFLVCHQGRWGILEVDGEPFHPPSRTVQDHERDRLFKNAGIRLVEHYDATECYDAPHKVVDSFLSLLSTS